MIRLTILEYVPTEIGLMKEEGHAELGLKCTIVTGDDKSLVSHDDLG